MDIAAFVITVVAAVIGGIAAYFQYKQWRAQQEEIRMAKEDQPRSGDQFLVESDKSSLGESFRRYFAIVLNRPFYPLADQIRVLERAKRVLKDSQESLIVVLDGAGGVGKTTIAGELIRQSTNMGFLKPLGDSAKLQAYEDARIRNVEDPASLAWSDLLNTLLTQLGSPSLIGYSLREREGWLHRQLHLEKYLVLVDNLETIKNAQEIAIHLRNLLMGSESRWLITYRYDDLGDIRGVSTIRVTGLSQTDSLEFLKNEVKNRGYNSLEEWLAEKEDNQGSLIQVIDLTHGLPLALQLVIGLRVSLPLVSVYDLLRDVTSDTRVEEIYEFLYREELRLLSHQARELLTVAFSKQTGYFRSELSNLAGLSSEETLIRLAELGRYSLLQSINRERPGIGSEDYFYIHPMLHQLLNRGQLKS